MGNIKLILISIGLLVTIIVIVGILYRTQKNDNSLYNEVTKLITNDNVKKMVDILTILTLVILAILLIVLELSIFLPSVEWGWLDRNTLITTFATIIGGFFGFIGASIGIIGTYGAFYLGVNKEKEKEENHKRIMLFNLLDHTITSTNDIYSSLNHYYKECVRSATNSGVDIKEKVSKYNQDDKYKDKICLDIDEDAFYIMSAKDSKDSDITCLIKGLDVYITDSILREKNLSILVYDDNWCSYLDCIKELREKGGERDMQRIINWLTFLKESPNSSRIDSLEFILRRRGIRCIIDELNKESKEEGFRGELDYK